MRLLKSSAYHEAGHAVVAWHYQLYFKIENVTIIPDDESVGHVLLTWLGVPAVPRWQLAELFASGTFLYAGMAAQGRYTHRLFDAMLSGGNDRAMIYPSTPKVQHDAYEKQARALVKQYWPRINAVAAALLEHRTIDGNRVRQICEAVAG